MSVHILGLEVHGIKINFSKKFLTNILFKLNLSKIHKKNNLMDPYYNAAWHLSLPTLANDNHAFLSIILLPVLITYHYIHVKLFRPSCNIEIAGNMTTPHGSLLDRIPAICCLCVLLVTSHTSKDINFLIFFNLDLH